MKQITIDFDLYQEELNQQFQIGFNSAAKCALSILDSATKNLERYDSENKYLYELEKKIRGSK